MTLEELKLKTVIELKAMAYDVLAQKEALQRDLQVLNNLIAEKQLEVQEPPKE